MSQATATPPVDPAAADSSGLSVSWRPRLVRLGVWVGGAWLLVTLAYLLGVALIVPVLVLVAAASLVRGGRSLLDRLMIALAVLLGASCLALLVFSVWPWKLHPVAVGGTALSVLAAYGVLAQRRPSLPRPTFGDLLSTGAATAVTAIVAFPLLRTDLIGRIAIVANGEDFARHVTVFDAARQVGGYLFLHWDAALRFTYEGMITYPQASHVLSALLDNFVRSSATEFGSGADAVNHYLGFICAAYGLFTLVTTWAAQWVAGPLLTPARRVAVVGVVGVVCLTFEIFALVPRQYTSEVAGLIPAVLLVAMLCRPPSRRTTVIAALLVVAIAFTYYLFLPAAALIVVLWAVRRRVWRTHRAQVVVAAVALLVAAFPPMLGLALGNQTRALLVMADRPPLGEVLQLGFVVAAGLWHRRTLSSPRWRNYLGAVVVTVGVAIALYAVQFAMAGPPALGGYYYGNKALHLLLVVLVLGIGSVLNHLPPPAPESRPPRGGWLLRFGQLVPAGFVVLAAAAGTALLINEQAGSVPARAWVRGDYYAEAEIATAVIHELNRAAPADAITVVIAEDPSHGYRIQLFLAVLQRSAGPLAPGMYGYYIEDHARFEAMVAGAGDRPVIIATDGSDMAADLAAEIRSRHNTVIDVVRLNDE
ncbi:MAG: hypothetical protein IRY85_10865 [Micromonosporaceae bacterium]|nr:hypothetical protein [Micromonosporaceae bacterium]